MNVSMRDPTNKTSAAALPFSSSLRSVSPTFLAHSPLAGLGLRAIVASLREILVAELLRLMAIYHFPLMPPYPVGSDRVFYEPFWICGSNG